MPHPQLTTIDFFQDQIGSACQCYDVCYDVSNAQVTPATKASLTFSFTGVDGQLLTINANGQNFVFAVDSGAPDDGYGIPDAGDLRSLLQTSHGFFTKHYDVTGSGDQVVITAKKGGIEWNVFVQDDPLDLNQVAISGVSVTEGTDVVANPNYRIGLCLQKLTWNGADYDREEIDTDYGDVCLEALTDDDTTFKGVFCKSLEGQIKALARPPVPDPCANAPFMNPDAFCGVEVWPSTAFGNPPSLRRMADDHHSPVWLLNGCTKHPLVEYYEIAPSIGARRALSTLPEESIICCGEKQFLNVLLHDPEMPFEIFVSIIHYDAAGNPTQVNLPKVAGRDVEIASIPVGPTELGLCDLGIVSYEVYPFIVYDDTSSDPINLRSFKIKECCDDREQFMYRTSYGAFEFIHLKALVNESIDINNGEMISCDCDDDVRVDINADPQDVDDFQFIIPENMSEQFKEFMSSIERYRVCDCDDMKRVRVVNGSYQVTQGDDSYLKANVKMTYSQDRPKLNTI